LSIQNCLTITGIIIVIIGLGASTYGAVLICRAYYPRNEWIIEAIKTAVAKSSYGTISPDEWHPEQDRKKACERSSEVRREADNYALVSKRGMRWIFVGFLVQVGGF
jgi:hypothetical protein